MGTTKKVCFVVVVVVVVVDISDHKIYDVDVNGHATKTVAFNEQNRGPFFRILWKSVPWNEQISHCMEDRSATQIILIFIFIVSTLCLEIYFLNGSVTFSNWNNDEKV